MSDYSILAGRKSDVVRVKDIAAPEVNSTKKETMAQVLGGKDDTASGTSLVSLMKKAISYVAPVETETVTTATIDTSGAVETTLYELAPPGQPYALIDLKADFSDIDANLKVKVYEKLTTAGGYVQVSEETFTDGTTPDLRRWALSTTTKMGIKVTAQRVDAAGAGEIDVTVIARTVDITNVYQDTASYDEDTTDEQTILEYTPDETRNLVDVSMDLTNVTLNATVAVYEKITDGGDYIKSETSSFTVATDKDLKHITLNRANTYGFKVTITPSADTGAASLSVPVKLGIDTPPM